jgi:hypothetical protein
MSLKRLVGIEFEFKRELQGFLTNCLANKLVLEYNTGGNTPSSRTALKNKFVTCGPSMGFSAKQFSYGTLELIVEALVNNPDVPTNPYVNSLNDQLVNITRYVGIAGEGDYHFMVAVYNLSETLSEILENVTPVGPIVTLGSILTQGTGYTIDGEDDTETGVVFTLSLASPTPPQYVAAKVVGNIEDGKVVAITSITTAGNGFAANDVGVLVIDSTVVGQESSTGSGATVRILTVN